VRIWSLHPEYLDAKGLVALWREALLARAVLEGKTRGYAHHPQLSRFKSSPYPLGCLSAYLQAVYEEASRRGYSFDRNKLMAHNENQRLPVTQGQLGYEFAHLMGKLALRDPERHARLKGLNRINPHPLFYVVDGPVAEWEILRKP
jgi:hypothetical protein